MVIQDVTWIVGLLVIGCLSALAARAEDSLWIKSKRKDASLRTQQLITSGKAHCR